jgi:hypothetical protein
MSQPSFVVLRLLSAISFDVLHSFVHKVMVSKTADGVSDRVFNGVRFNGGVADDVFFGIDATGTQVVLSMDSVRKNHSQAMAFLKSILNHTAQLRVETEDQALQGCSRLSAEDKATPPEATMRFDTPWDGAFNFYLITDLTKNVLISGDMTTYDFKLRGVSFLLRVVDGKIIVDSDTRCGLKTYEVFSNFCAYLLWESKRLIDGCAPSYAHLVKDLAAPEAAAVGGGGVAATAEADEDSDEEDSHGAAILGGEYITFKLGKKTRDGVFTVTDTTDELQAEKRAKLIAAELNKNGGL